MGACAICRPTHRDRAAMNGAQLSILVNDRRWQSRCLGHCPFVVGWEWENWGSRYPRSENPDRGHPALRVGQARATRPAMEGLDDRKLFRSD
jgi:hypothetical protein